jgi:hypothetical protein
MSASLAKFFILSPLGTGVVRIGNPSRMDVPMFKSGPAPTTPASVWRGRDALPRVCGRVSLKQHARRRGSPSLPSDEVNFWNCRYVKKADYNVPVRRLYRPGRGGRIKAAFLIRLGEEG